MELRWWYIENYLMQNRWVRVALPFRILSLVGNVELGRWHYFLYWWSSLPHTYHNTWWSSNMSTFSAVKCGYWVFVRFYTAEVFSTSDLSPTKITNALFSCADVIRPETSYICHHDNGSNVSSSRSYIGVDLCYIQQKPSCFQREYILFFLLLWPVVR